MGDSKFSNLNSVANNTLFTWGGSDGTPESKKAFLQFGTYTPTLTGVANVASATAPNPIAYSRLGNWGQAAGSIAVTPTANGVLTTVRISLPPGCASDFTTIGDGGGGAADDVQSGQTHSIEIDTANNAMLLKFSASGTGPRNIYFHFGFIIK